MNRFFSLNRFYVKPITVIDVSSIVVVPEEWTSIQDIVDGKTVMTCMLYHPKNMIFSETKGIRIKIQDSFPNIRENRMHAWICVNYSKLIFNHLRGYLEMRVVGKTFQGELLVRLYTRDIDRARKLGLVYLSKENDELRGGVQYREFIKLINYQIASFGHICVNDIMNMYSNYIVRGGISVNMDEEN